jgi:hypothetical protein
MRWQAVLCAGVGVATAVLLAALGPTGGDPGPATEPDGDEPAAEAEVSASQAVLEVRDLLQDDDPSQPADPSVPAGFDVQLPTVVGADLLSTAVGDWGSRATWEVDGAVDEVAASVLGDWQEQGTWGLYYSGYLDFSSSVWGCVVQSGTGDVMVCLVDGRDGSDTGQTCALSLLSLGV